MFFYFSTALLAVCCLLLAQLVSLTSQFLNLLDEFFPLFIKPDDLINHVRIEALIFRGFSK